LTESVQGQVHKQVHGSAGEVKDVGGHRGGDVEAAVAALVASEAAGSRGVPPGTMDDAVKQRMKVLGKELRREGRDVQAAYERADAAKLKAFWESRGAKWLEVSGKLAEVDRASEKNEVAVAASREELARALKERDALDGLSKAMRARCKAAEAEAAKERELRADLHSRFQGNIDDILKRMEAQGAERIKDAEENERLRGVLKDFGSKLDERERISAELVKAMSDKAKLEEEGRKLAEERCEALAEEKVRLMEDLLAVKTETAAALHRADEHEKLNVAMRDTLGTSATAMAEYKKAIGDAFKKQAKAEQARVDAESARDRANMELLKMMGERDEIAKKATNLERLCRALQDRKSGVADQEHAQEQEADP